MITIWESTASDLQYHVFFLGAGLARTGSRDSDLSSDEYRSSDSAKNATAAGSCTRLRKGVRTVAFF